ncbi:MAG: Threonine dehydratase [Brockia lithotrophica]|uniref:L-threonine dehydratase catabolic TdcB n=1 Tax=Brockia lithotrophica TaxID=933949 RepID=A0A2T5G4G2_9BACL|nr:threonine ammonia-lyase [Brockia lithotrophica]PTQ51090.1 MAG: Threonine dehydratase [Brockia lithotrophica]
MYNEGERLEDGDGGDGDYAVTPQDVFAARARLAGVVHRTPFKSSRTLSERFGASVYLKLENLQRTGSYKIRGAYNKLATLLEPQRARGVIAASAGNHAQGVAWSARTFGVPCIIVMPETAPLAKIQATESYGARVVLHGKGYDDAYEHALRLAEREGYTFVHAFDDPAVIAGQGTVAVEMWEDVKELDLVLVPVGGGGLISGIAVALKFLRPDVRVVGVQAQGAPALALSFRAGRRIVLSDVHTIADGIAVRAPGEITFPLIRALVDDFVVVREADIVRAISFALEREKLLLEGAGAVTLAALLAAADALDVRGKAVGLVLSGGNIDLSRLSTLLARAAQDEGKHRGETSPPAAPERFSQDTPEVHEISP